MLCLFFYFHEINVLTLVRIEYLAFLRTALAAVGTRSGCRLLVDTSVKGLAAFASITIESAKNAHHISDKRDQEEKRAEYNYEETS